MFRWCCSTIPLISDYVANLLKGNGCTQGLTLTLVSGALDSEQSARSIRARLPARKM
jgi:hypothetical protein